MVMAIKMFPFVLFGWMRWFRLDVEDTYERLLRV
jgi:hypothetical protein